LDRVATFPWREITSHEPAGPDLETVDKVLSTTRSVRRRLDFSRHVPREVILECIRLSQQAPTGSNQQTWRWLVVTDEAKRRRLGQIYARGREAIMASKETTVGGGRQTQRAYDGALWLAERIGEAPALVIPCAIGRPPAQFVPVMNSTIYGSVLPAVWSFQLALRSRGLGSCFTTVHLMWEDEVRRLFGMPEDVLQVAMLPVAYTIGTDFKPARRPPAESITYWDRWDAPGS